MGTNEKFERGREVAKLLLDSASGIDKKTHDTTADEDHDMAYFIAWSTYKNRRVGLKIRRLVHDRRSA